MEPAKTVAELEIGVDRLENGVFQAELRFLNPASRALRPPAKGDVRFDLDALRALELSPEDYGAALGSMLFSSEAVQREYQGVMAAVQAMDLQLRVRLCIGQNAPGLHDVRWELLSDPNTGAYLFTSDRVPFSRFMYSPDWRNISLRRKADLTALVAVSSPSNQAEYELATVDIDGEIGRALEQLKGVQVAVAGRDQPLTVAHLLERLREPVDILYLVCHGTLANDQPYLFLQADDGSAAVEKGRHIADRIRDLPYQPRMAVLASCESAGTEWARGEPGSEAMHSFAPMLAEAGVPAIIAMRGKISIETVKDMMPVFFHELMKDGQIDRTMAAARSVAVARKRPDFWMPVLYLRLSGGCIWYEPGFGSGHEFEKWKSIVEHVREGRFVPILGSGVAERICGDSRSLARGLANKHGFPLARHQGDDLAVVAQFLSVTQDHDFALKEVRRQMRDEVLKRHGAVIPAEMREAPLPRILDHVLDHAEEGAVRPYRRLAALRGSVYVSATPDSLMAQSLRKAGVDPCQIFCNWRSKADNKPVEPVFDGTESAQTPVVYQMLGLFGKNDTLVLTENDYFDYMIATAQYQLIPRVVRSALASRSLLFLGFQLTDWSFRVLFRLIESLEGRSRRDYLTSVGVQINPEAVDVEKAQRYLQQYYDEARIAIFWGTTDEFLDQLSDQLGRMPNAAPVGEAEDDWVVL